MWKRALVISIALAVVLSVSACGRKGAPEKPPGSDYPRQYPKE